MVVYIIKCILFSVTREFEVLLEDQSPLLNGWTVWLINGRVFYKVYSVFSDAWI